MLSLYEHKSTKCVCPIAQTMNTNSKGKPYVIERINAQLLIESKKKKRKKIPTKSSNFS